LPTLEQAGPRPPPLELANRANEVANFLPFALLFPVGANVERRKFLQYGFAAGAACLVGGAANARAAVVPVSLSIEAADVEMIDGEVVFQVLFFGQQGPRPTLRAVEGDQVSITVRNNDTRTHGFAIPGVAAATISAIGPGATRIVSFTAPRAGTYLYIDHTRAPVNRLLGLFGALVVAPRAPTTNTGALTPFSRAYHTSAITALFDALGPSAEFPGLPWRAHRERMWLFSQIDPVLNRRVDAGYPVDATTVMRTFAPRYFTLNGKSGFDAAHDPDTLAKGYIGEPLILRVANAGLATHSPHIHGNHVFELSGVNAQGVQVLRDNIVERDTWIMAPMDRKDMLLPFTRPNDIPDAAYPPVQERFPLKYPMHCHTEMSQTAGGGNYPQGLIADWEILGPRPPVES
jgi:FtsP/CotA-like multicopper oxidase with cupredoxin domain